MSDPRLEIVRDAIFRAYRHEGGDSVGTAAAMDAADPFRRALTPGTDEHEAMVELILRRQHHPEECMYSNARLFLGGKRPCDCLLRPVVGDVLAALREAL